MILCFCVLSRISSQNQTCSNSTTVAVNACSVISKNITATSNSVEAPTVGSTSCLAATSTTTNARDIWVRFTATNTTATITVTSVTAGKKIAVITYSSTCSGTLITNTTELGCVNTNTNYAAQTETLTLGSLTIGTEYLIRAIATGTAATATSINIGIYSPVLNDDPFGAFALPAVTSSCSYSLANLKSATPTSCGVANPSCGNYGAGSVDIWYSAIVPASGNLFIQTSVPSGSIGIATYTGTPCGSLTEVGCSQGSPEGAISGSPSLYVPGLAAGTTVYIRAWNQNGSTGCTFSICATSLGPCGNVATNDFCSNPASVSTSAATGTSVATNTVGPTGSIYTTDTPGNLTSNACANFGQNAWFSFVATTTSQSIPFTVAGCAAGLEAEVFAVSTNTYGCCKTFTSVSSNTAVCTPSTYSISGTGTIVASPLTIGNTYYLMVNSISGQSCTYTVTGWSVSGILPIEFISFIGKNEGRYNQIEWVTSLEQNVDNYTLERSSDAITFEEVLSLKAKGTQGNNKYNVRDEDINLDLTYYRLKQKDHSGAEKFSNIISVNLKSMFDNIFNLHPNPTTDNLNFEYYSKSNNTINIELLNYAGASVLILNQPLEEGKNNITLPMSELDKGVYILKVISESTGKTTHHKIIKN